MPRKTSSEIQMMDDLYTVNQLAEELGMTARALRFYETKGLITPRRLGSTRVYTRRERARMQLILRGKRLGFSLVEIKQYLDLYDADHQQVEQIGLLLDRVGERLRALEQQRRDVEATIAELEEIERQAGAALRDRQARSA